MITFEDARRVVEQSSSVRDFYPDGFAVAAYGWENAEVFVLAVTTDDGPAFDAPDLLVDKQTGELREAYGLFGEDPAPDLVPIGDVPE
ncbi:hypothetical protein BH11ACT6_BH11ACT6_34850 [soil metagenome]